MTEQRIQDLEQLLVTANASIATLTASNLELTRSLSGAETRNKKLRRGARRDTNALKEQLAAALSRRG
jgi:phage shock protein A